MKIFNLFILIFIIFFNLHVNAIDKNIKINVVNNVNIDNQIIFSILNQYSGELSDDDLNEIIKKLKTIDYISDVNIKKINEIFEINITANKIINNITLLNNKRFKKDELNSIIPFDKFLTVYNKNNILDFINEVKNLYSSYAYNQIDITYEIIDNKDNLNFVDIKFFFNEGKISKTNKINFIGNTSFNASTLMSHIKSKPRNLLKLQFSNNFKKYVVNNDVVRIKNFYLDNGYRDVKIKSKTEYIDNKNKFNIYFFINEGNLSTFNNIDIQIDLKNISSESLELIKIQFSKTIDLIFKKNKIYNFNKIQEAEESLINIIYDQGFNFFSIDILELVNDNNINLKFVIKDDTPNYVRQINIYGNTRTLDKVIRKNIPFAESDSYTSKDIAKINSNLKRLDFFKEIDIQENEIDNNINDIDIIVDEKPTGDFQIGVSFGTLQGATLITKLNEKNIAGSGRNLTFEVNNSENNSIYKLSLTEPYAFNKPIDISYGLEYNQKDYAKSSSYKVDALNFNFGINFYLLEKVNYDISFNYELRDYLITDTSTVSSSILNASGKTSLIKFMNRINYNDLDSYIMPTKGSNITFVNSLSPSTNSNGSFVKNEFIHRKFIPVFNKDIFSIQSRFGNVSSFENKEILSDNKFSLGGRWLRGFDSYGAGPRNSYTSYQGGNNLIVIKFDYSKPIDKLSDNPVYFNLFTDIGKIWGNKNNPTNYNESIRSSYGYGIKYYSPIGPLGFSWAFPIQDENYDIKRSFLFSIGNIN